MTDQGQSHGDTSLTETTASSAPGKTDAEAPQAPAARPRAPETEGPHPETRNPTSLIAHFSADEGPLKLDGGQELSPFDVAYQTYGTLNADKSNAILVCHALTGDQHVANDNPITGKPGWWSMLIGPGRAIDTERFFVICPNILGGCAGSTGPASINPATGKAYGLEFPVITIGDMVAAQVRLIDRLGIDKLFAVVGGSMGGMQVLEWAARYGDRVYAAVPIATAAWHSSQNIAFHEVGRQAVKADPDWCEGRYLEEGRRPKRGLAVARMAAHITYLSEEALQSKFGRQLQDRQDMSFSFDPDFQVESYLRHQGSTFVDRFDANSYLYITRAMDYFDLAAPHDDILANAFKGTATRFCVVSFTSDWLYPTRESKEIVQALNAVAANVSFVEIESDKGHDAFLLNEPEFFATVSGFIDAGARRMGLPARGTPSTAN
jgi:homoserine O-acetyltransferase